MYSEIDGSMEKSTCNRREIDLQALSNKEIPLDAQETSKMLHLGLAFVAVLLLAFSKNRSGKKRASVSASRTQMSIPR
jgi:hypothetical protein